MANLQQISSPVERARCLAIPPLGAFVEALDPSVEADPDAFWDCSDAFAALMQSTFLADVVAWELECLRRDPDHVPCPRGERDLEIFRLGRLSLSVRVQLPDRDVASGLLYGFCEHHISANVGPGSLQIDRWMQGWEGPPEIFDRTRPLVALPSVVLRPGEQAGFHAHRDVASMRAVDSPAVVVGLTRVHATRLRWVYDAATLLPVRAEAGDLGAARLEYAMMLLAALEHTEAAPAIATLYDHPDHFVRWSAVRRVMELDPSLGEPLVRRALNDIHPHVRRAAQRSIERYEAMRATAATQESNHGAHA
jgi:hypothetical protein